MSLIARTLCTLIVVCLSSAPSAAQSVQMTVGSTSFPNSAGAAYWEIFIERMDASFGDRLTPKYLLYGELGSEENLLSSLRRGRIDISGPSAQAVSTVVPEVALLYAPYLFQSYEEVDYVIDNHLSRILSPLFEEKGLILLEWFEVGFHHVYGRTPLLAPEDAKGLRFRTSSARSAQLFAAALDADVIPMGFADVVTSLQTGMIESGENAASIFAQSGIAEEAKHFTTTQHSYGVTIILTRKSWFERLSPADQAQVRAAIPSAEIGRRLMREEEAGLLAQADEVGYTIHRLSAEQRDAWRAATEATHAALVADIGGQAQHVYDQIIDARREFRALKAEAE